MYKALLAVVAAAALSAIIVVAPGLLPGVEASTPPEAGKQQPLAKGDRLDVRLLGAACSKTAWPYYERDCLFERSTHGTAVRMLPLEKTTTR